VTKHIILASASPRRQQLLSQIGVNCHVHPVTIDETPGQTEPPESYVCRIAAEKSECCFQQLLQIGTFPLLPILAADTSVILAGQIFGKPTDAAEAYSMLTQLSGQTHQVLTAVSIRTKNSYQQRISQTAVTFRSLRKAEIEGYWQNGESEGTAGAYAIQGLASIFVQSIEGSFSGVVGLPLFETAELLTQQGIKLIT